MTKKTEKYISRPTGDEVDDVDDLVVEEHFDDNTPITTAESKADSKKRDYIDQKKDEMNEQFLALFEFQREVNEHNREKIFPMSFLDMFDADAWYDFVEKYCKKSSY